MPRNSSTAGLASCTPAPHTLGVRQRAGCKRRLLGETPPGCSHADRRTRAPFTGCQVNAAGLRWHRLMGWRQALGLTLSEEMVVPPISIWRTIDLTADHDGDGVRTGSSALSSARL